MIILSLVGLITSFVILVAQPDSNRVIRIPEYIEAQPVGVQWAILDSLVQISNGNILQAYRKVFDVYKNSFSPKRSSIREALLYLGYYIADTNPDTFFESRAEALESWLVGLKSREADIIRAIGYQILAQQYWRHQHLALGLEFYIRAWTVYSTLSYVDFPLKSQYGYDYSGCYYYFRDFHTVKDILLQLERDIPVSKQVSPISSLNTIGICYRNLDQLDSAAYYFKKALARAEFEEKKVWIGIIKGNMASVLVKQKQYDQAILLLESNIASSRKSTAKVDLAYSLTGLAEIYLVQNKHTDALVLIQEAYDLIKKLNKLNNDDIKSRILIPYGQILKANGRSDEGFAMLDEGRIAMDSVIARRNTLLMSGVQLKVNVASHLDDMQSKEAELRQQQMWNVLLSLVALGVSIFTIVFFRQKKKISNEQQRSEALLLNILPAEIARDLKEKGKVPARHFENVTILFTDFCDFTKWVEKHTADELVADLDLCFRAFDDITTRHGLEKIKTIGDAYMAVAGLPRETSDHAICAVEAALEIRNFVDRERQKRQEAGASFFEIRIGLHTGPVVAGVIGLRKFTYDIWGDTVNIGARMESSGEAGKVNISETTFNRVKDQFNCTFRGRIPAKNKGEVGMYFVEGKNE